MPNNLGIWKSKMLINTTCTTKRALKADTFLIEKRNNISYKLTSVISDKNVSPNPCCIKENGKMEKFTDNYFIDVQRINFLQSEFNDTSPVDVPLITEKLNEQ
uniref:Uncharacterized protein n=1 Tax=Strongyloides venezuelensis TaxID=75913 RepID=A0A0K0G606_STRVS